MGFSKKTGRGRLDKFYYLAKEQGYRARSAFKLKQLDQKFNFLSKARVLIDLCAAPGGWLQVATESMPMSHVIVGVDLVPIKPIKGVTTIVGDITSDKCRSEIHKELSGWKADVVLHDGAPNVGNAWIQDAFSQAELTLHSFKLATTFLNDGGVFLTKVFRSKEYPIVLSALKKYFKKVEATKPESSRSVSAEIFVFCRGFDSSAVKKNPVSVREILSENSGTEAKAVHTNLLHPEKKNVNREGYEDNVTVLHKCISLTEFLNSRDPETILSTFNQITVLADDEKKFVDGCKNATEIHHYCSDLKVLGRKDFRALLKIHKVFTHSLKKSTEVPPENVGDEDKDSDVELFNELKSHKRSLKKRQKRLLKTLNVSKNHMDVSQNQMLEPDELAHNSTVVSSCDSAVSDQGSECSMSDDMEDDWYENPIFGEVFDELSKENPARQLPRNPSTVKSNSSHTDSHDAKPTDSTVIPPVDEDELIDLSFNRYAYNEDKDSLPVWFVEEEKIHNVPQMPITKEIADLLRENERIEKNRLPKKVLEAKNRKKMKTLRKVQTLKKKAAVIADSEDIGEGRKIVQIQKLLAKSKVGRTRPKLVVAKGRLKATKGRPKGISGKYKMVDRRMFKDLRAKKNQSK